MSESQLPPDRRSDEELKTSSRVFPVFAIFSVIASHSTFAYKGKALEKIDGDPAHRTTRR